MALPCRKTGNVHPHHAGVRSSRLAAFLSRQSHFLELWRKLGDDEVSKAAYRGRCLKPARTSTRERYAMNEDNSIVQLRQPKEIDDPLTALLRSGARQLLEQAIEAEVAAFLAAGKDLKLADGRDRL